MAATGFWDNQELAQETVGQLKSLKSVVAPMTEMISNVDDLEALIELGEEDPSIGAEISTEVDSLEKKLDDLELKSLLNGAARWRWSHLDHQCPRWRNGCQ